MVRAHAATYSARVSMSCCQAWRGTWTRQRTSDGGRSGSHLPAKAARPVEEAVTQGASQARGKTRIRSRCLPPSPGYHAGEFPKRQKTTQQDVSIDSTLALSGRCRHSAGRRGEASAGRPAEASAGRAARISERLAESGWKPRRMVVAQKRLSRPPNYRYMNSILETVLFQQYSTNLSISYGCFPDSAPANLCRCLADSCDMSDSMIKH